MKQLLNLKITATPNVLGMVFEGFEKNLGELQIKGNIDAI